MTLVLIKSRKSFFGGKPRDSSVVIHFGSDRQLTLFLFDAARAHVEAGAFAQADSELEVCMKRRGEATALFLDDVPTYHLFPVYYYLGRSQQGLKSAAAADSYKTFITIENGRQDPPLADAAAGSNLYKDCL